MVSSSTNISFLVAIMAFLSVTMAIPTPEPFAQYQSLSYCPDSIKYEVSEETVHDGPTVRSGGQCCEFGTGCSLSAQVAHTVGVSVTTGASLSLDLPQISSLGVNAEITYSVEDTTGYSSEVNCDEGFTCCLAVTPKMVHVAGTKSVTWRSGVGCAAGGTKNNDYAFEAPKTTPDGSPEMTFSACIALDSKRKDSKTLRTCPS